MRPFNEARPGWELVDVENFGRLPGEYQEYLIQECNNIGDY